MAHRIETRDSICLLPKDVWELLKKQAALAEPPEDKKEEEGTPPILRVSFTEKEMKILIQFLVQKILPRDKKARMAAVLQVLVPWRVPLPIPDVRGDSVLRFLSWSVDRFVGLHPNLGLAVEPSRHALSRPLAKWLTLHHLRPWCAGLFLGLEQGLIKPPKSLLFASSGRGIEEQFMDGKDGPDRSVLPRNPLHVPHLASKFHIQNEKDVLRSFPAWSMYIGDLTQNLDSLQQAMPWFQTCSGQDVRAAARDWVWKAYLSGAYYPTRQDLAAFLDMTTAHHTFTAASPAPLTESVSLSLPGRDEAKGRTHVGVPAESLPVVPKDFSSPVEPEFMSSLGSWSLDDLVQVFSDLKRWYVEWEAFGKWCKSLHVIEHRILCDALEHRLSGSTRIQTGASVRLKGAIFCVSPIPLLPNHDFMELKDKKKSAPELVLKKESALDKVSKTAKRLFSRSKSSSSARRKFQDLELDGKAVVSDEDEEDQDLEAVKKNDNNNEDDEDDEASPEKSSITGSVMQCIHVKAGSLWS